MTIIIQLWPDEDITLGDDPACICRIKSGIFFLFSGVGVRSISRALNWRGDIRLLRADRGLSYDCEGELVVSLGNECDCVAVSGLEGELVSSECAAGARRVDWEGDAGAIDYGCRGGCGNCPCCSGVLVTILVLDVIAG